MTSDDLVTTVRRTGVGKRELTVIVVKTNPRAQTGTHTRKIAATGVTRVGNTRANVSPPQETMFSTHMRNMVTSSLCLATTVESPPRPPLPLLFTLLALVTVTLTNPAEIRTRASQVLSALATDKPTAVGHLPRVCHQHCLGKTHYFHKMLVL